MAGRISSDVDLKDFSEKLQIASFFLAVDRGKKRHSKESTVDFLRCKAFNRTAVNVHSYCKKGSLICVTGQIHNNRYEKDGETKYATEIIIESVKFLPNMSSSSKEKTPDEKWNELSYDEKFIVINDYHAKKKTEVEVTKVTTNTHVEHSTDLDEAATYKARWSTELNKEDDVADELKEKAEAIVQKFSGEPSLENDDIKESITEAESTEDTESDVISSSKDDDITDKSLPF
ncbi:single-stranded DNA-binding protein [Macrococcus caseolyticus]|nr:single-stranded DNA-binding protein [Macrococcus caseolyticus]